VQLGPVPGPPPPPPELDENGKPKKKKRKKGETGEKPKRVSLPKGLDPNLIDLTTALKILGLPREVGPHPETKEMILAGLGRFGPYLKMGPRYKSLTPDDDVLHVGLNRAVALLAEPVKGGFGGRGMTPGKPLGEHPDDGKPVTLHTGRYGPYVKWGKVMATVTKAYDPENLDLKGAIELIEAKVAKGGGGKPAKAKAAPAKAAPAEAKPKKKKAAKG
jgi:DNA topoisomerase-1